jgi:hypothetical protein
VSAAAALARAEAAGIRLRLRPNGGVRMEAAVPPPPDVLADLRRWREDVAHLLAVREGLAAGPRKDPEAAADGHRGHRRHRHSPADDAAGMAHEVDEMQAFHDAEAAGAYPVLPAAEHRAATAGLMRAALMRPPAWADTTARPAPGAWCGCCGRAERNGGRWWQEAAGPRGWRCMTCYPPPSHLGLNAMREVET